VDQFGAAAAYWQTLAEKGLLVQSRKTRISAKRAELLLFPLAAFLRAGGLSKESAARRFSAAFDRTKNLAGVRRIEHIGHPMLYADIVTLWAHDSRFLNEAGRPRSLAMEGKNEFSALVRTIDVNCDPLAAIQVLCRYGNVRKGANGKYRLIRPLFFASTASAIAFEPIAYFLADASSTLGRILRRTKTTRGPELFWRKVETSGLSPANARQFVAFVRERGQEFLEELDEWLEGRAALAKRTQQRRKLRRVGLGMFSIDSSTDLESSGV
jgi:hypothetical protein